VLLADWKMMGDQNALVIYGKDTTHLFQ